MSDERVISLIKNVEFMLEDLVALCSDARSQGENTIVINIGSRFEARLTSLSVECRSLSETIDLLDDPAKIHSGSRCRL